MAAAWLVGTVLIFLVCGVLGCSALGRRRRSRYHLRLVGASLVMSALAIGLAAAIDSSAQPPKAFGLLWLLLLLAALAAAPVACYRSVASSGGSSDGEGNGGGGPGLGPGPSPTPIPRGGLPLPDADQARTRRRDHLRPSLSDVRRRRGVAEPVRHRAPAGPGRTV